MSLIGSISLTNKEGVFLGEVSLSNLNLDPEQIVYSLDGINMSGLNLGDGLQQVLDELVTVGNPNIQLTSNSLYVNDNQQSIQSAIDTATQADVIYVSAGSYGERLLINNKTNIAIQAPDVGNTICEVLDGVVINGTSELIRITNLQIEPSPTLPSTITGVGRHYFKGVVFQGFDTNTHLIEIGKLSTQFMTFIDCSFDEYCTISISSQLAAPLYFINCNFGNCSITYGNLSPLLVIMSNCAGLKGYPLSSNATLLGVNVLVSGQSQVNTYDLKTTLINGSAYPPTSSGLSATNQAVKLIPYCTATNNELNCEATFNYDDSTNKLSVEGIGASDIQTTTLSANTITASYLESVLEINGEAYPPPSSGVSVDPQVEECIPFCSAVNNELTTHPQFQFSSASQTLYLLDNTASIYVNKIENLKNIIFENGTNTINSTNEVLTTDGAQGFKLTPVGGEFSNYNVLYLDGQQTIKTGANIDMVVIPSTFGKIASLGLMWSGIFNFSTSTSSTNLTITLTDKGITKTYTQALSRNGHHQISFNMWQASNGQFDIDATVNFAVSSGSISTDTSDYYSLQVYNIKNFASGIPV
jgi:hypothetical protein